MTRVVAASARPLRSASSVNVAGTHDGIGISSGAMPSSNSESLQLVFLPSRSKNKFSIDLLENKGKMYI
ncbi:MAG: hypothetical protein WA917_08400 [Comamonas sp.]|nr:hypothetical protein [Comamonas sp.]